jgi:hypothetical protein
LLPGLDGHALSAPLGSPGNDYPSDIVPIAAEDLPNDTLATVRKIDVVATIRGANEGHHQHRRAAIFVDQDQTEGKQCRR